MEDMEENMVDICLHVLKAEKKTSHDSYRIRNVPVSNSVARLKAYLLERCKEEIKPANDCNFSFGYIGEGNKKYSITSEVQLAEALSLEKRGMVTLWVDPHVSKTENSPAQTLGKKRKGKLILG